MIFEMNKQTIWRGQDEQLLVHMVDENSNPLNLAGLSAITIRLKKQDGTVFEKAAFTGLQVGIKNPLWIYAFQITSADSLLLKKGAGQTAQIKVTINGNLECFDIKNFLTVVESEVL